MDNKIFSTMVKLQHKFNKQVAADYLDKNFNWNSAIIVESGEMLESLGYKWWKKQEPDMDNAKIEAIDLLHFVISHYLQQEYNLYDEIDINEIANEFKVCFSHDYEIKSNLLELIDTLNFETDSRFSTMKRIFEALEMSNQDIYIAYIVKNCLNKFRQDNGYKEGTYVKDWNGKEDNVIAYTIANEWGADEELFEHLYLDLTTYYNEEILNTSLLE